MKDLIKQYLDQGLSRRQLVSGLSALGMSTVAAKAMAQNLTPAAQSAAPAAAAAPAAIREVEGNGGRLFVEQLKAAGVEHIFFNPSTGDHPIFDALVDVPEINLIKGIQEGAVVAMADGYARASGRTGVVVVANIGLPNAMTQMVNTWKDQIPMLVAVASVDQDALGRDQWQETDHHELMTEPITKWFWQAQSTAAIAETTRRGLKFASTPPCGPVFLSLPTNTLDGRAKAQVWERSKFDVPMRIRPDKDDVEKAARMLIEAQNPLISIGDEITWCRGQKELIELAELLGAPVAGEMSQSRLLVETVPDPASAVHRHASAHHALSGQTRRAAQPRQSLGRIGGARHQTDLDPARSGEPRAQRAGRSRHGGRSAARHRRSHRGDPQHGDRVEAQGYRRAARGEDPRLFGADGGCAAGDRARAWRILRRSAWSGSGSSSKPISTATPATSPTSIPARPWTR